VNYSTGRETNFDILPSTVIQEVDVYKTPLASQVEGGMGAVIDVKTARPLALGNHVFADVSEMHRDLNGKNDLGANGMASWRNDASNFGILFGIDYSVRSIRQEDPDSFGWWSPGIALDTTASGQATTSKGVFFPFSANFVSRNEQRKRLSENSTIQWVLPDDSSLTFDVLHSRRVTKQTEFGSVPLVSPNILAKGGVYGNGIVNPDGSYQAPGAVVVDNSVVDSAFTTTSYDFTDQQQSIDNIWVGGLNYKKTIGAWELAADLARADSRGTLRYDRASMDTLLIPLHLYTSNSQLQGQILPGGPDLGNAANYTLDNADATYRVNVGKETALALDAKRNIADNVLLSGISFGLHLAQRTADRVDNTSTGIAAVKVNAGPLQSSMLRYTGNYAGGRNVFPMNSLLFPDITAERAYLLANFPYGADINGNPLTSGTPLTFTPEFTPATSYSNREDSYAFYVQADIDTNIADIPVKGNVGVRAVETESTNLGYYRPFLFVSEKTVYTGSVTQAAAKNNYANILPSLNLSAELAKNLILRFGMGKTMTRPTFSQLAPGLTGTNPSIKQATAGNPLLKAYESTNVDIGLEWYINRGSAVYGTVFAKDISNFIGTSVTTNTTYQGTPVNSLSEPLNEGKATIAGVELGYQQTYDIGIGYLLNATYMNSSADYVTGVNEGKSIPFVGVSKRSYNAQLFYEKHGLGARLAYTRRSEFVVLDSDAFGRTLFNAPYGQLDASVSYDITKQFSVVFSGINLLDAPDKIYSDIPTRAVSYSVVGRRYQLGVRGKF
jgi:TonB-dependent receptor